MAQNLGDVVTVKNFYTQNGFIAELDDRGMTIREFTSYDLIANQQITFDGECGFDSTSNTDYPSYCTFKAPKIIFNSYGYGIYVRNNGKNSMAFLDSSVNFDNSAYDTDTRYIGPISFTGNSSINITSSTNGKTIIKASTLTGTVSLDVESGVQDGDTFLIEATDNQLVITDGEWTATPSISGNVTTYTLTKAAVPKPKFRMLYTIG